MIDIKPQEEIAPAHTGEVILQARGLSAAYHRAALAIEDVNFNVRAGERVAVIGPNGAGKSTLVKTIMGLMQPQAGRVLLPEKARLGYVPQHESVDWNFPVTVRDVVMMGRAREIGLFRWPRRGDWRVVESALERTELTNLAGRQIGELSGGQRRRVFIARALAQEAGILLLDEPFSGVDASVQASLMDTLDRLNHDGLTIILTTHDLGLAFNRFDRVMALNRRVIAYGSPAEVYRPDVLAKLYGGRYATWDEQSQTMLFLDDHHCDEC